MGTGAANDYLVIYFLFVIIITHVTGTANQYVFFANQYVFFLLLFLLFLRLLPWVLVLPVIMTIIIILAPFQWLLVLPMIF